VVCNHQVGKAGEIAEEDKKGQKGGKGKSEMKMYVEKIWNKRMTN
jgi:hypothetical protein